MSKSIETYETRVRSALERYPQTRDNDTYLEWILLREHLQENGYNLPWVPPELFSQILKFNFENVRRQRQKIQANGEYPPSDPIILARRRKQESIRAWAITTNHNRNDLADFA